MARAALGILPLASLFILSGCGGAKLVASADSAPAHASAGTPEIQWVRIPGGSFMMGDETFTPRHEVSVKSFQLAKTLVTNKQYRVCVAAGPCTPPADYGAGFDGDDQPVVGIDWNQAQAFAKWGGGRLPTEAEWEYAARSGGKDRKYPWGDEAANCSLAATAGCGGRTVPVCSKPASNTQQGLCDMAGNATEWMQDWYHGSYVGAPADGSAWEEKSATRVIRGGNWRDVAADSLCANRDECAPDHHRVNLGFRPARDNQPAAIRWVTIPGGTFTMGSADSDLTWSMPAHRVTVKSFQMAETLVTNKQYKACVAAGACTPSISLGSQFEGDDQPVVGVDWNQAKAFSQWAGGRLPTEAEWEYAARSAGKDWRYPWGNEDATCERAAVSGCGSATAPVCSTPAGNTQQGLCDMAGNAWEWVEDTYHGSYNGAPTDARAWEDAGPDRVYRGGSWYTGAADARSTFRNDYRQPGLRSSMGFRPAR